MHGQTASREPQFVHFCCCPSPQRQFFLFGESILFPTWVELKSDSKTIEDMLLSMALAQLLLAVYAIEERQYGGMFANSTLYLPDSLFELQVLGLL